MEIDPDTSLLDIDAAIFNKLAKFLERNNAWKTIAEFNNLFNQNEIKSLSLVDTPGKRLLNELGIKMCTVQNLAFILRECHLYDALSLIVKTEPMKIMKEPSNINGTNKLKIALNDVLRLEFEVVGLPPPLFTWYNGNEVVSENTTGQLVLQNFNTSMEGEYYCYATQYIDDIKIDQICSNYVTVETLPMECIIIEQPEEIIYATEGSPIVLKIKAIGYPKPKYIWMYENKILEGENKNILHIPKCSKKDEGAYRCRIFNKVSDILVKVTVIMRAENKFAVYRKSVTEKVALLIGNDNYENLECLPATSNDVKEVATILNKLGFKTLTFRNLNLYEMNTTINIFASKVKKGAYAFFYYAGHGFKCGDKFLLPVACPNGDDFMMSDAISESRILQSILNNEPALFISILDMCLKAPERLENDKIFMERSKIVKYHANRNLIRAYSTTSYLGAYESVNNSSGIYVSILKKYLNQNIPILSILAKVNSEMCDKCPQQMPQISYITAEDYYLSNPLTEIHEDKSYEELNFVDQKTNCFTSTITLTKYKNVFLNTLEMIIENTESIEYESNWKIKEISKENNKTILLIEDIQRLPEVLEITLKINNEHTVSIKKSFEKLRLFFVDI